MRVLDRSGVQRVAWRRGGDRGVSQWVTETSFCFAGPAFRGVDATRAGCPGPRGTCRIVG